MENDLRELDELGFVPAPNEDAEKFTHRAELWMEASDVLMRKEGGFPLDENVLDDFQKRTFTRPEWVVITRGEGAKQQWMDVTIRTAHCVTKKLRVGKKRVKLPVIEIPRMPSSSPLPQTQTHEATHVIRSQFSPYRRFPGCEERIARSLEGDLNLSKIWELGIGRAHAREQREKRYPSGIDILLKGALAISGTLMACTCSLSLSAIGVGSAILGAYLAGRSFIQRKRMNEDRMIERELEKYMPTLASELGERTTAYLSLRLLPIELAEIGRKVSNGECVSYALESVGGLRGEIIRERIRELPCYRG